MSKFTKGPWEYNEQLGAEFSMISGDGVVVASIPNTITETDSSVVDLETNRANAHLISAAPELLEACKKFVDEFGRKDYPKHSGMSLLILEQSKKAIAKATNNN